MLNKIRKLRAKKGFTLVELIVVIAIIAILTAVLVPLVGNYVQQAAYATLMDAAQTISNSGNNALANYSATGKVSKAKAITGTKSGGKLIVKVTGGKDEEQKAIIEEMENILEATLPSKCAFYIAVDNGAVEGVVYVNDSDEIAEGETKGAGISGKDFFDNTNGGAIGVSGKYKAVGKTITAVSKPNEEDQNQNPGSDEKDLSPES